MSWELSAILNATLTGLLTDVDEPLVWALTQTTAAPAELCQVLEEVRLPSRLADRLHLRRPMNSLPTDDDTLPPLPSFIIILLLVVLSVILGWLSRQTAEYHES